MKNKFYQFRCVVSGCLLFLCVAGIAQPATQIHVPDIGHQAEDIWGMQLARWQNDLANALHADNVTFQNFLKYNEAELNKDQGSFFRAYLQANLPDDSAATFLYQFNGKYAALYQQYLSSYTGTTVPATNAEDAHGHAAGSRSSCNPACSNMSFQNGTLSYWDAYWAVDASTVNAINNTYVTGGACGSVTQDAQDPNTSSYQVSISASNAVDPVVGNLIPLDPPLSGKSARVGDGEYAGRGVGILEQTFTVQSSSILTVQYAVVLQNPGHSGFAQPWFRIEVLDNSGNAIPGCGQYFIAAKAGIAGFIPVLSPLIGDTVYCKPWTTAFVPLYGYVGQCVTVRFTSSDCALGGHFGYAYVAASCSKIELASTTNVFCTGQPPATITGPPGAASYQWATANGCISGSGTQQAIKVSCAGTYSLITTSTAGAQCVDTFSFTLPASNASPPLPPCFAADDTVCAGKPATINASCTTPANGLKYYWDFYNTGRYQDSSGTTPAWTYTTAGTYLIHLHTVAANGCSSDTVKRIIVGSTGVNAVPQASVTTTDATACTTCNGKVALKVIVSATAGLTITNSRNSTLTRYTPPGSWNSSGSGCNSLSVSGRTATITCQNVCPGTFYFYITPTTAIPATKCSPGGFTGDTIEVNVGVDGVNFAISKTIAPASCGKNNGSIRVSASGAASPYTYNWSSGLGTDSSISNVTAGTYVVSVTDANGCSTSSTTVVDLIPEIGVTLAPRFISCFGANDGKIKVTTRGGIGKLSYNWSPNISSSDSAVNLSQQTYSVTVSDTSGCSGTASVNITQPTKMTDTITGNYLNLSCSQTGDATISVRGGYSPYSYRWSNGVTSATNYDLTSGTYTVTVTDGNRCTLSHTIGVGLSGAADTVKVNITASGTAACAGSRLSFTATPVNGGSSPFYQWQVNGKNAGSGTDIFSVDTLKNSDIVTVIVTSNQFCVVGSPATSNPIPITIYPVFKAGTISSADDSICAGSNATLTVSGNSGTVYWQSSSLPLSSGFSNIPGATGNQYIATPAQTTWYRVYGANNNCSDTSSLFRLSTRPAPGAPLVSSDDSIICASDSTRVCAPGGYASYHWNTGDTTLCTYAKNAGGYWTTVTLDNGCMAISKRRTISVYPASSVSIIVQGDTMTSFGQASYQWYFNGTLIPGADKPVYIAKKPGAYTLAIIDGNGCTGTSSQVNIGSVGPNGIINLLSDMVFEVYPNPASSDIQLKVGSEWIGKEYEVYDVFANVVATGITRNERSTIDISAIAKGVYFIKVNGYVRKFMKL